MSHARVQLTCLDPSKTKQSFKDECDVNRIMAKWRKTGELNHLTEREPTYGDFTNATDYLAARQAVIDAQADFNSLSASIRDRMGNDPGVLLSFLADPANVEEGIALGLIEKPAAPPPDAASMAAAAAIAAKAVADAPPQVPDEGPGTGGE